jgi:histidinol phosphatase-like enzyme (inositol monophosphatase family)
MTVTLSVQPDAPSQPWSQSPVHSWLDFAAHLAALSAATIKPYFRSDIQVDVKADLSPVTIADREAERVMREAILANFPAHGVMGEELGVHNAQAEYQWVLDPIDGTKSFIAGSYLFGTLIALLRNGRPIAGVINHPIFDDLLIGDGQTAWLNGKRVQARACSQIQEAVLVNTSHWGVGNYHNALAFEQLSRQVKQYRNWGDCHGYYLVATGGADIMLDPILNDWDLMALIPIVEGAGGRITDWQGRDAIGGNGAVATAGPIHEQVIRLLNPT